MKSINTFQKMKAKNNKIVMVTAYDFASASLVQKGKADVILVGDSLGMVVLGYENTLQVTMEDMIHHTKAVRRGADDTFIIADLPYGSYHISREKTRENALRMICETKADAVKLEGGSPERIQMIKEIVSCEIPVCAHLGLTPQSVNKFGGFKVQGKTTSQYEKIIKEAKAVDESGAFMLVLEGIPEKLAKEISELVSIPTIGIGAGRFADGQVLVYHDLLGVYDFKPKFVKKYIKLNEIVPKALMDYRQEVKEEKFPNKKHIYYPMDELEGENNE